MLEMDVVRLTYRGEDIALGRSQVNGVRRPSPVVTPSKPATKPLSLI